MEHSTKKSMKWEKDSYLFDIRPGSGVANLFVAKCSVSGQTNSTTRVDSSKDLDYLTVESGRLRLVRNSESDSSSSLSAFIGDKLNLHPQTIEGSSCNDNGATLQCRICVDDFSCDFQADNAEELLDGVKGKPGIRSMCDQILQAPDLQLTCGGCDLKVFGGFKFDKCKPVPDEDNWQELSEEWFCHQHQVNPTEQPQNILLVNEHYLFLPSGSLIDNTVTVVNNIIRCRQCNYELGIPSGGDRYRLSNLCFRILLNSDSKPVSLIQTRFKNHQRYFAWLLLSHRESQASMKFLIRSLLKKPRILVWLLDSYSYFISGKLVDEKKTGNVCRSTAVLKVLYKLYDDDQSVDDDPRAQGEDSSIATLDVPSVAADSLMDLLLTSTQALPYPVKSLGCFYVGYLDLIP